MLEEHLEFINCPECFNSLNLEIFQKFSDSKRIKDGILKCNCSAWFPIINGVPRLLSGKMSHLILKYHFQFLQKYSSRIPSFKKSEPDEIQERTAYTHDRIRPLTQDFKKHDMGEHVWISPLTQDFYKNKIILDAGCRLGNHTYFAAKFGAKLVIGIDIGESVEFAFEASKEMDNALILQADIHNIPTKKIFDYIFSIGVLHHLPDPEIGFRKLVEKTKSQGVLLIWVYMKENYQDLKIISFLRKITIKINPKITRFISIIYNILYYGRMKLHNFFRVKGIVKPNPWFEYLNSFSFRSVLEYLYNQLAPPIAYYYRKEDLEKWFNIKEIESYQLFNMWNNGWKSIIQLT